MSVIRSVVRGVGHYLPDRVVENAEFETWVETSDAWIRSRSGIERRHFAAEGQTTSDLATRADPMFQMEFGCAFPDYTKNDTVLYLSDYHPKS